MHNRILSLLVLLYVGTIQYSYAGPKRDIAQLKDQLSAATTDSVIKKCYAEISEYYKYHQPDSARLYLNQGIKQFSKSGYLPGKASLLNLLGRLESSHSNLVLADNYLREGLKIFEVLGNKKGIGQSYNAMGIVEGMRGHYDTATRYFITALQAYEAIGYNTGIVNTYINLGRINSENNNPEKSLEYYKKGLDIVVDTSDVSTMCNLYNNIAVEYGKKGELNQALIYINEALKKSNREQFIDVYVYSLMNIGVIYSKSGDQKKALTYLEEALTIAREKGLMEEYARLLTNLAEINGETNTAKGLRQLKEALSVAQEIGNRSIMYDIYSGFAELYKKTGDYKSVVSVMETIKKFEDSTTGVEKAREIANLQAVYDLEKAKNQVNQLEIAGQAQRFNRNLLLILVAFLVITIVVVWVNLGKTRKLNARLLEKETELTNANTIKNRLFSIIAHDLRSPLSNITMAMALMEDKMTDEEDVEMMAGLIEQTNVTLETLDKLLFWGKVQIGGKRITIASFNPGYSIDTNITLLKMSAERKHITVTNNAKNCGNITGDASHFDFILRNLLANAVKFTKQGGAIAINADANTQKGYIVFSVADNGIGIVAEKLAAIFEPFINNSAGTALEKGTGIGLMLCREFVLENKGKIWVESKVNEGTTFYFTFPAAQDTV